MDGTELSGSPAVRYRLVSPDGDTDLDTGRFRFADDAAGEAGEKAAPGEDSERGSQQGSEQASVQSAGWRSVMFNFSQSTTLHGINKISEYTPFLWRRLLWVLIVLTGVGLFVWQLTGNVILYRSWPVTVNVKINYNKTLAFPAVTICNQNDFKITDTSRLKRYWLVKDFYTNLHGKGINISNYNAENVTVSDLYEMAGHRKVDTVVECRWDGQVCSEKAITQVITDYGLCITFNRDGTDAISTSTGSDHGLSLLLNIEQYEYMRGPSSGAGLKLLVHHPDEIPLVKELGAALPPGSHSFVGVQILKVRNLPPPHGQCDESKRLRFSSKYTVSGCRIDCLEQHLVQHCGCRDVYMPSINGYPPTCTLEQYQNCAIAEIDRFSALRQHSAICDCPVPCDRTFYDATITYADTSVFDADIVLQSKKIRNIRTKYWYARETMQVVDEVVVEQNRLKLETFVAIVTKIDKAFEDLHKTIKLIRKMITAQSQSIKQRIQWHWINGLRILRYTMEHSFVRGWEVMDERTFSHITTNYMEIAEYISKAIRNKPEDPIERKQVYMNVDHDLLIKEIVTERAKTNLTKAYNAFLTPERILTYKATPNRRYDEDFVFPGVIQGSKKILNETYETLEKRLQSFLDGIKTMRNYSRVALKENKEVSQSDLYKVLYNWQIMARSINYRMFMFRERVVNKVLENTAAVEEAFLAVNTSYWAEVASLQLELDMTEKLLVDIRTPWKSIEELKHKFTNYLTDDSIVKTWIARTFTSKRMKKRLGQVESFFPDISARLMTVGSNILRLEKATRDVVLNMVQEASLKDYYYHLKEDVLNITGEGGVLTQEQLRIKAGIKYMLKKIWNDDRVERVLNDTSQLIHETNVDFAMQDEEKWSELIKLAYKNIANAIDYETVVGEKDVKFEESVTELEEDFDDFLTGNKINRKFFK